MKNCLRPILRPLARATAAVALAGLVASCSPIMRHHGFVPSASDLAQLQPGRQTRAEVLEALPAPTTGGAINNGNIYYVASSFRTFGPFNPKEVSREVVALTFDGRGVLSRVERFGLEDGIVVPISRRITPGSVADMSFIRQLMGNIGRFDPSAFLGGDDR